MRMTFDISSTDDARQAADICEFIADSFAGSVSLSDTERPVRATRRTRKLAAVVTDLPAQPSKADILADYNMLAAAGGSPVIEATPEPETETRADREAAAAAQAELDRIAAAAATARAEAEKAEAEAAAVRQETAPVAEETRADKQAKAKQVMLGLGFMWVRENVTKVYGRTMLSELTDAELDAVYAAAIKAAGA